MSVTIVSCVYGAYRDFVPRWAEAIGNLDPAPDEIMVAADSPLSIPGASVIVADCNWKHPQGFYLDRAIRSAATEWVWIVDVDDIAKRDGLEGLDAVDADVWQMGFDRSDGVSYAPEEPTNRYVFLESRANSFVGGSAFRVGAYRDCGGFPDVAFQDWGLWRRLVLNGASFAFSGRAHFDYMRHQYTRSETELLSDVRADHYAEMLEAELAHA